MLITGEEDYRTPISESEQFYQALKLRKIDTALVRIPDASHDIADRPSHLIAKVAHILAWFDKHRSGIASQKALENALAARADKPKRRLDQPLGRRCCSRSPTRSRPRPNPRCTMRATVSRA